MTGPDMSENTIDQGPRRRFESAWHAGRPEPIEQLLPAEEAADYLTALEELVGVELQLAWQTWAHAAQQTVTAQQEETIARPPNVETYLQRFPRLNQPEILLRLVQQERSIRRRCGEDATIDEYRRRFPEIAVDDVPTESALPMVSLSSRDACLAETFVTGPPGVASAPGLGLQDFGNYQSLEEIGRGGMGIVYRARQRTADRIVALKVIRRDRLEQLPLDTHSTALDRFRHEAQAAAKLEHEHIVTVYEVGEIDGQPFFSMRYVEGRSLSEILREGPMENRRAAAYLEPVARAVHEAHCQGILHRDLKPQNILVDDKTDHALVADFGLAKLTHGSDEITRAGEIMGTPSYMSPEQAKDSARVGAETDVYALGATLYHVLTARPPFQAATPIETLRQVIDEEPAPPKQLNPSIDLDLETICLKCLQKEPLRRYDSAEALADDLRRYLAGEPILARPIGAVGRIWRWCLRKPALATAIALAATFLVVGSVVSTVLLFETRAALRQSEKSFDQAQGAVKDFLTLVGEETLLNEPGMEPLRKKLLSKARDYYQQFLAERGNDPTIRDDVALAHFREGLATEKIDSPEKALVCYYRARDLQGQLVSEQPEDRESLQNLGNTWTAIGRALAGQRKLAEARSAYLESIKVRKQLTGQASRDESEFPRTLANSYMNLGIIEQNIGLKKLEEKTDEAQEHFDESRRQLEKAQEVRGGILARLGDSIETQRDLGKGHYNLAVLAMAEGKAEPAEKSLGDAIEVFAQLLKEHPESLANQSDLAMCHRVLADLKSWVNDPDAARLSYQEAQRWMQDLVDHSRAVPSYRAALASLHMSLGQLESKQKRPQLAREQFEAARELLEPLVKNYPDVPEYGRKLTDTLREAAELE